MMYTVAVHYSSGHIQYHMNVGQEWIMDNMKEWIKNSTKIEIKVVDGF